jgi:hypothetical protein
MPFFRLEESAAVFPRAGEPEAIQVIGELTLTYRGAVLRGDRKTALALMPDIQEFLLERQKLNTEAEQFISSSYANLLLIFAFFITVMALGVWFIYRALEHFLSREREGSVFSRSLVLAQEEERARVDGELHDTVAQDPCFLARRIDRIGRTDNADERETLCPPLDTRSGRSGGQSWKADLHHHWPIQQARTPGRPIDSFHSSALD